MGLSPPVFYFCNLPATTSFFVAEVRCFWNMEPQKIQKVWVYPGNTEVLYLTMQLHFNSSVESWQGGEQKVWVQTEM